VSSPHNEQPKPKWVEGELEFLPYDDDITGVP
jgi:hypothetical protein